MLKRIISYYWDFCYNLKRYWWITSTVNSKVNGIVLMFHHVTDEYIETNASCKCRISRFQEILDKIYSEGRRFVSVEMMIEMIQSKATERFSVVTFDDVPDDFFSNAYPILKKMKIPFVLFITINFIDKPGFLKTEQLLELDKDPLCTIGAHTITHPMLRKVDDSEYEIAESKRQLEQLLGHPILYMAYPYGRQSSVSQKVKIQACNAGYECAFGTIQAPITDTSSKELYYLPRMVRN